MKEVKRSIFKITQKALRKINEIYVEGWPPVCAGLFHQPKRPERRSAK